MIKFRIACYAISFVLFIHGYLLWTDGYVRWDHIDILLHLMGGFAMALLGYAIHQEISRRYHQKRSPLWYEYVFVVGFVMLIGVLWEFHEYLLDQTVNMWYHLPVAQPSIADIMKDLMDDWIGASAAFCVFRRSK